MLEKGAKGATSCRVFDFCTWRIGILWKGNAFSLQ